MDDDEKPFDLRDRLAIEILNGVLANSKEATNTAVTDLVYYMIPVLPKGTDPHSVAVKNLDLAKAEEAVKRMERLVRSCYKLADIMRKVRLSAFE